MELAPGTVIDRYTVEGFLGEGGMAVVYRVRHNELKTVHALKLLSMTSPSIKQRLLREGRVQAQLRHPNIVTVTDIVESEGAYGLVMDLVRGPTLHQLLAYNRLTIGQADVIAHGLLSGMRAAHDAGLIHRDLKPANVLIDTNGGHFQPKIADFGLAKIATGGIRSTRSGVALGTPSYMAPEQVRSAKDVDHRADIFALGAILYEVYCGVQAFAGQDVLDIFKRVTAGDYPPAAEVAPDLPGRVIRALEGSMQVQPEDRFDSVGEMMKVLLADAPTDLGETKWDAELLASVRRISEHIPSLRPDLTLPPVPLQRRHDVWVAVAIVLAVVLAVVLWPGERRRRPRPRPATPAPVAVVVEPEPAPRPAPAPVVPRTRVLVEGDVAVEAIRLVAGELSLRPGEVEPGEYEVRAILDDKELVLGQIALADGEEVTLRCSAALMVCRSLDEAGAEPEPEVDAAPADPEAVEAVWTDPGELPEPAGPRGGSEDGGSPWADPGD